MKNNSSNYGRFFCLKKPFDSSGNVRFKVFWVQLDLMKRSAANRPEDAVVERSDRNISEISIGWPSVLKQKCNKGVNINKFLFIGGRWEEMGRRLAARISSAPAARTKWLGGTGATQRLPELLLSCCSVSLGKSLRPSGGRRTTIVHTNKWFRWFSLNNENWWKSTICHSFRHFFPRFSSDGDGSGRSSGRSTAAR